ncbi:hypothetical protein V7793_10620 [Streptomyces sp. KLMMK]
MCSTSTAPASLAISAARLASLANHLRLLRGLAEGRHLRAAQRPPAAPGPRGRRPKRRALRVRAGLPDHQDLRQRAPRGPGHGRGKAHHRPQAPPRHGHPRHCC